jgi:hypothetical protein
LPRTLRLRIARPFVTGSTLPGIPVGLAVAPLLPEDGGAADATRLAL